MSIKGTELLQAIKEVDFKELDLQTMAGWPTVARLIIYALLISLVVVIGYQFHLSTVQENLQREVEKEQVLKSQLKIKVEKAHNLQAYREQMKVIKESFSNLVHQLPGDTEVPSLLEDITQIGLAAGLEFDSINLKPEANREFFIELPILIQAKGKYHDIANFVSGVSSLKRIVTLHNFHISPDSAGELNVEILAKTYRYKDEDVNDG